VFGAHLDRMLSCLGMLLSCGAIKPLLETALGSDVWNNPIRKSTRVVAWARRKTSSKVSHGTSDGQIKSVASCVNGSHAGAAASYVGGSQAE
jgi:hypothetical protein